MNHLRTRLLTATVMALLVVPGDMLAFQNKSQTTTDIDAAGCVQAGVEAGCLVLSNPKSKTLYNLFFKGKKPAVGTAIRFTGTSHEGPTSCMQGEAIDVKTWKPIKMQCTPGKQK